MINDKQTIRLNKKTHKIMDNAITNSGKKINTIINELIFEHLNPEDCKLNRANKFTTSYTNILNLIDEIGSKPNEEVKHELYTEMEVFSCLWLK